MNACAHGHDLRPFGRELARVLVPHLAARARTLGRAIGAEDDREGECARLGLALGLVASACGIEVLRGRRERRALPWLIELLACAVGEPLDERWGELPELSGRAGAGWEAPVLVGWTWLAAARAGRGGEWSQEHRDGAWWFLVPAVQLPASESPHGARPWRWRRNGARLGLGLPRAWLARR